jgi:hypothetical protein
VTVGIRPTAYQAAVFLSGIAAVLGLGRELLMLQRLGLGEGNDALQFALSIVYTVALFGEPLRLGSLNFLGRRIGGGLTAALGLLVVAVAAVTTAAYARTGPGLPVEWIMVAGAAGAANLVLAWVLPRSLKAGPFLPVHAVSVMPSVLIVAGLLLPADSDTAFAERVVYLFLAAPVLQLVLLGLLRGAKDPDAVAAAGIAEGLRPVGWHAVSAGGTMATQFFIRSAVIGGGPAGALSAFVVALRATETLRAVFVDTYIASRLRRWSEGRRDTSALVDGRWLSGGVILLVVATALGVALAWPWAPGSYADPSAVVLLLGLYLVLALRVRYQERNVAAQPLAVVRRIAGLEVGTAAAVGVAAALPLLPLAVLPWLAYVVKPAIGLRLVAARETDVRTLAPEA